MAIAYGGAGAFSAVATTPNAPALPAGTVAGDVLLAPVFVVDTDGTTSAITTASSGWSLIQTGILTATGGEGRLSVFRCVVPAGGATAPSFACTGSDGMYAAVTRWTGVDGTDPEALAAPAFTAGDSTTATASGVTTVLPGVMVVHFYAYADNWNMINPTNGATLAFGTSGYESITGTDGALGCAYKLMPAWGASGDTSVTASQSPAQPLTNYLAATVALRPAIITPPGQFLPFFG